MKNKGITLVALVVTIIIMLILAGVTLRVILGDNGLFNLAKKSTEAYQISSEREYLEQNILSLQLEKYTTNVSSNKLGKSLVDKNLKNSSVWDVVLKKSENKTYGTGWNYVEKGTELPDYGTTKSGWLVNYETGELIQIDENEYLPLSAGDMLAVKDDDHLIINVDSTIVDSNIQATKENLEKQFGVGVKLYGFDLEHPSENSGLSNTSFNFDGEDDYIAIDYNSEKQKNAIKNNGFTFEFYGKLGEAKGNYGGLFGYRSCGKNNV